MHSAKARGLPVTSRHLWSDTAHLTGCDDRCTLPANLMFHLFYDGFFDFEDLLSLLLWIVVDVVRDVTPEFHMQIDPGDVMFKTLKYLRQHPGPSFQLQEHFQGPSIDTTSTSSQPNSLQWIIQVSRSLLSIQLEGNECPSEEGASAGPRTARSLFAD